MSSRNGHSATIEIGRAFEREAPSDQTAEAALLGAMLLEPAIIADVEQEVVSADAFWMETHATLYAAMVIVWRRAGKVDVVQVRDQLAGNGADAEALVETLVEYATNTPSAASWRHYARIIHRHHVRRAIANACGTIAHAAYDAGPDSDTDELIDLAESTITELSKQVQADSAGGASVSLEDGMLLELDRLDRVANGHTEEAGIASGFADLDHMIGGFLPGQLVIVGARPSIGKTAWMLNAATHAALQGVPVAVFSLEMTTSSVVQRVMCAHARVAMTKLSRSMLSPDEFGRLTDATGRLAETSMHIDDTAGMTVMRLRSQARRFVRQHKVGIVFVDYLQLLTCPGKDRENRQVEVSAISRGLKALAKELEIPVVCLAQLNRQTEQRSSFRPRMSDLRESGSIEQDADVVLLLHREEAHHIGDCDWLNDPSNERHMGTAELIVTKQRNGPTGSVTLAWDGACMAFGNCARSW